MKSKTCVNWTAAKSSKSRRSRDSVIRVSKGASGAALRGPRLPRLQRKPIPQGVKSFEATGFAARPKGFLAADDPVVVSWRGDECLDQPRDTAVPGGGAGRTGRCLGPSDSGLGRAGLDRSRAPVVRGLRTARAGGFPLRLCRRARPLPGAAALDAAHPLSGRGLRRLGGLERLLRLVPGALDPARTPNEPRDWRP
ncbi:MAG: hypothetical protein RIS24_1197 [Verrucomicrobiota bacterium]